MPTATRAKREKVYRSEIVNGVRLSMEPFNIEFQEDGHYIIRMTFPWSSEMGQSVDGSFMCWSEEAASALYEQLLGMLQKQ